LCIEGDGETLPNDRTQLASLYAYWNLGTPCFTA